VLEALWRGPTFFTIPRPSFYAVDFSRDGRWLAAGGALWPADGGEPVPLEEGGEATMEIAIGPRGDVVASQMDTEWFTLGISSVPEGNLLRKLRFDGTTTFHFSGDGRRVITATDLVTEKPLMETVIRSWPLEGGEPDTLARIERAKESVIHGAGLDPTSRWLFWPDGVFLHLAPVQKGVLRPRPSVSLEHPAPVFGTAFNVTGKLLATADTDGDVRVWSLERDLAELLQVRAPSSGQLTPSFDTPGKRIALAAGFVWDIEAPEEYEPVRLLRMTGGWGISFEPSGNWIATGQRDRAALWPISRAFPQVIRQHQTGVRGLAFAPDGSFLVSASGDGTVRSWPLPDRPRHPARLLLDRKDGLGWMTLAMDPTGRFAVAGNYLGEVIVVPLDGSPSGSLPGFTDVIGSVAIDRSGRFVAAGSGQYFKGEALVRVWDLKTGEVRTLDAGDQQEVTGLEFTLEGDLLVSSGETQRLWNIERHTFRVLPFGVYVGEMVLHPDRDQVLLGSQEALRLAKLSGEGSSPLEKHGTSVWSMAFDRTGQVVISGDEEGVIRLGRLDGGEPHLLLGHEGGVGALAVSPDNRWIASGGQDGTIRLWPMPDLSKPPLHTLPYDDLLAKLHELTNLRAVPDPGSATGYKLETGPFPGWVKFPEWWP
jgi:WD40 repeat protein